MYGCGEQEVVVASGSGWNLWVWLLGVVVRRYIDFLILLIITPLVSVLFLQQHPYFLFIFKNVFHSLIFIASNIRIENTSLNNVLGEHTGTKTALYGTNVKARSSGILSPHSQCMLN